MDALSKGVGRGGRWDNTPFLFWNKNEPRSYCRTSLRGTPAVLRICLNKRRKPTYDFSSVLSDARIMSTGSSTVEFASDCALRRQQARLKLRLGPLCAAL